MHNYIQQAVPLLMGALVSVTITYHILKMPALGGYLSSLIVSFTGALFGGTIGSILLKSSLWRGLDWGSLVCGFITSLLALLVFHGASRLHQE